MIETVAYWRESMKEFMADANQYVVYFCQMLAMIVIMVGVSKGMFSFLKDVIFGASSAESIQESRMEVGHSFSLGLNFLIGGSILSTTLDPNWNDIGQLAAIIAIRTILNYFLLRDIHKNMNEVAENKNEDNKSDNTDESDDSKE
jgi:uncharacterized membrane protein